MSDSDEEYYMRCVCGREEGDDESDYLILNFPMPIKQSVVCTPQPGLMKHRNNIALHHFELFSPECGQLIYGFRNDLDFLFVNSPV